MKIKYLVLFVITFLGFSILSAQKLAEKEALIEGNIQYAQKKYKEAQTSYEKALTQNKKSLKGHYNLGNTFYNQDKTKEAIKQYSMASKLTNNKIEKSSVYHNLGNAYMKQKEYENAVNAYKNSLKNNPLDDHTRYNYALAKLMLKKEEDKKPEAQKQKEKQKKQKEEQKKKEKENQEKQDKSKQDKKDQNNKNKEQNKGKQKGGEEQNNNGNKKEAQPRIDSRFSEGVLRAVERQEQQTHKRMIEEQKAAPRETNKKDW